MIFQHAGRATARHLASQSSVHSSRVALAQHNPVRVNGLSHSSFSSILSILGQSSSQGCLEGRRGYATEPAQPSAPSKAPKAKSTKAPRKRSAAKKPGTAAKKPGKAAAEKKKPGAKKAKAKKPKAKKVVRAKKEPTEKQKVAAEKKKKNATVRELKQTALTAPRGLPASAFSVMLTDVVKEQTGKPVVERFKEAGVRYKSLSADEKEHYNHLANQNKEKNAQARDKWIASLTPAQIHDANNARVRLRKMGVKRYTRIKDPRLVKKPLHAAIAFSKERYDSGDMKGIALAEASKLIQREWKDLTDAQKRPYYETELKARQQYVRDVKNVYNRDISMSPDTTASRALASAA